MNNVHLTTKTSRKSRELMYYFFSFNGTVFDIQIIVDRLQETVRLLSVYSNISCIVRYTKKKKKISLWHFFQLFTKIVSSYLYEHEIRTQPSIAVNRDQRLFILEFLIAKTNGFFSRRKTFRHFNYNNLLCQWFKIY